MKNAQTFMEISIGGVSKEQLIQNLVSNGVQFNKYANELFAHPEFSPLEEIKKVSLVRTTYSDFGLSNPFSYLELIHEASKAGLRPCPIYLGAFLRLEFMDQPEGSFLTIASVKPAGDYPNGFYIRNHDNALWLRGYRAEDVCEWPDGNEFIFLKD